MSNLNKQSGFTLVEIAIVLVIIGLLLGGVLKGQEMIKNAEIRGVITDVQGITTAVYAYRDRYNAIPGDDILGVTHTGLASSNGTGDGVVGTGKGTGSTDNEDENFFAHLRQVNLIAGSGITAPTHPLGGAVTAENSTYNFTGNLICMSGIDGSDAVIIESKEDDGDATTGTIQGSAGTAAYATGTAYKLCFKI